MVWQNGGMKEVWESLNMNAEWKPEPCDVCFDFSSSQLETGIEIV